MEYSFFKGRDRSIKIFAWGQICLQALFPIIASFSASSVAAKDNLESEPVEYSEPVSRFANLMATEGMDGVESSAKAMAVGKAASDAEKWLNQFGTARLDLNVDNDGNWDQSSFDMLLPLYDNAKSVWFTQFGLRAPDGRVTSNIGSGVRTYNIENWMLGGNVFFDDDLTGKNRRIGFGAEAWTNYLKLSANNYIGTSQWHDSRDLDGYYEKPADGFDIRAEGYMPAWPQMGAKLVYEQYYGKDVALFDTDHLQNNPSAVTVGLSYTPVPLISLATNYRKGQDSMDDTQFQLNLRYQPGQSWREQLDPDNVRLLRTLAGSRYDLVERNNEIILQYKKKHVEGVNKLAIQAITDNAPADGLAQNTVQVVATDSDDAPVPNAPVAWSVTGSATLSAFASVTNSQGVATVNLTNVAEETVQVTATSGAKSATQASHFVPVTVSHLTLTPDKDGSVANGAMANSAVATVTDVNNRPIANAKVSWTLSSPARLKASDTTTNEKGQARAEFVSDKAGQVTLRVNAGELSAEQQSTFVSDAAGAKIASFIAVTNGSPANGSTPDTALVTVTDANGNPVSGMSVSLTADKSTVAFLSTQAKKRGKAKGNVKAQTDGQGQVRVVFTDTVSESVTLTATLENGDNQQLVEQFVADNSSAALQELTLTRDNSVADGIATNAAKVSVKDANGNPVSGMHVNWLSDKGTVSFKSDAVTDDKGEAVETFTDTVAETVTVKAQLDNGSNLTTQSHFVADQQTATLQNLNVTKDGSPADGTQANTAQVYVKDAKGNPLAGQEVTWSSDKAGVVFAAGGKSDDSGKATVSYTSSVAQTFQLKAQLANGQNLTASSSFVADTASEHIKSYSVTSGALANGTDTNSATVIVTDNNNNPVSDASVTWSISGSARLSAEIGTTDRDGKLSVTFTDTKAEAVNVRVQLGSSISETKSSTFVGDNGSAKIGELAVTSGALANGTATNAGKVTVVDANGNPLSGLTVTWTVTGNGKLSASESVTAADGTATVTIADTKAEQVTLSAAVNGDTQSKPMTFVADASSATIQTMTLDVDGSKANGVAANKATVQVVDGQKNPVSGLDVSWIADKTTVQLSPSGKTDSEGKASVTFTDTVAQQVTLKASLPNGNNKSTVSQFIADTSTATIADMVISPDNVRADGVAQNVATVTVKDAQGNILPGQNVSWSASRSSVVLTPSGITDANGQAHVTMTDNVGGNVDITATLDNASTLTKQANFLSINVTKLQPSRWGQDANGNPITFTATVTDSSGAPVANSEVAFSNTGKGVLSATTAMTDSSGNAVVSLTDLYGEEVTVTARATVNPQDSGLQKTVTFYAQSITKVIAGGHTFDAASGFPKTGFRSAIFQLVINDDVANNANYTWSTDHYEWVRADANGNVQMVTTPESGSNTVTVTAMPKWGGQPLTYTFTLQHWIMALNHSSTNPSDAERYCAEENLEVPSYTVLSNGQIEGKATRAVGTLWGEWGALSQYSWGHSSPIESDWAKETNPSNGQRVYVNWYTGYVYGSPSEGELMDIACHKGF